MTTFAEVRGCVSVEGCGQLNAEAKAVSQGTASRQRYILGQTEVCERTATRLDAEGRDITTTYTDGNRISLCPLLAEIQFKVIDNQEASNA